MDVTVDPFDLDRGEQVVDEGPHELGAEATLHERHRLDDRVLVGHQRRAFANDPVQLRHGRRMLVVVAIEQCEERRRVDEHHHER
jgi:hypothetical protein